MILHLSVYKNRRIRSNLFQGQPRIAGFADKIVVNSNLHSVEMYPFRVVMLKFFHRLYRLYRRLWILGL